MRTPKIDFFVIGAARSGTTSIFRTLSQHPDVYQAPIKEPRFFDRNWDKGWDWYSDIYEDAPASALCGDYSPSYSNAINSSSLPKRIAQFYPKARILYMVRNPIECAISNWRMTAEISGKQIPFEEAMAGPWAVTIFHRSMFFKQLGFYREHFPDEQIMVAPLELVRTDPLQWLARIQTHLGLPPRISVFPRANASHRKPDRPAAPDIPIATRQAFLQQVTPDALEMLDHLGHPPSTWNMSVKSPAWSKGMANA